MLCFRLCSSASLFLPVHIRIKKEINVQVDIEKFQASARKLKMFKKILEDNSA